MNADDIIEPSTTISLACDVLPSPSLSDLPSRIVRVGGLAQLHHASVGASLLVKEAAQLHGPPQAEHHEASGHVVQLARGAQALGLQGPLQGLLHLLVRPVLQVAAMGGGSRRRADINSAPWETSEGLSRLKSLSSEHMPYLWLVHQDKGVGECVSVQLPADGTRMRLKLLGARQDTSFIPSRACEAQQD